MICTPCKANDIPKQHTLRANESHLIEIGMDLERQVVVFDEEPHAAQAKLTDIIS